MVTIRLTSAVKMDAPFFITGDAGSRIQLSSEAADWAVTQKLAVYEGAQEIPVVQREPLIPDERKVIDPADLVSDPEAHQEPESAKEPPKRPYGNAPKSAWVEYVVAIEPDMTRERAETMSKADLMSGWGQRLL